MLENSKILANLFFLFHLALSLDITQHADNIQMILATSALTVQKLTYSKMGIYTGISCCPCEIFVFPVA
jgi:hypothetical protein